MPDYMGDTRMREKLPVCLPGAGAYEVEMRLLRGVKMARAVVVAQVLMIFGSYSPLKMPGCEGLILNLIAY